MAENTQDLASSGNRRPSMNRKSSLFRRAGKSYYRSGGTRGASVETLRGNTGAEFESTAQVQRGRPVGLGCGCFGGDQVQERFILIKGHFLFVFSSEDSKAPKYAIDLTNMKTEIQPSRDETSSVLLETALGDIDYEFIFDTTKDPEIAQKFSRVVAQQSAAAAAELAKKRLGHEHLIQRHASVKYAEAVGMKKKDAQPDAPLTANEIADAAPIPLNAV